MCGRRGCGRLLSCGGEIGKVGRVSFVTEEGRVAEQPPSTVYLVIGPSSGDGIDRHGGGKSIRKAVERVGKRGWQVALRRQARRLQGGGGEE